MPQKNKKAALSRLFVSPFTLRLSRLTPLSLLKTVFQAKIFNVPLIVL